MTYFRDMGTVTLVGAGPYVRAVGWLDPDHWFPRGPVSAAFLDRLQSFAEGWSESARLLNLGRFFGGHTCEFCENAYGKGNFGVPSGNLLFIAPELIAHYVSHHGYSSPLEFVSAVMASPLPGTDAYRKLVEPFVGRLELTPEIGQAVDEWLRRFDERRARHGIQKR